MKFLLISLAAIAAALPTDKGIIPGKFVVALKPTDDLNLHARWVSDVNRESLSRRGVESVGIDKTFSFPGFKGYSGSFDEETIKIIKANSTVSTYPDEDMVSGINQDLGPARGARARIHCRCASHTAKPPMGPFGYFQRQTTIFKSLLYLRLDCG